MDWPVTQEESRRRLARHLEGRGIEIGPGHQPFPGLDPDTHVDYVDRWRPPQVRALFPELVDAGLDGDLVEPDVLVDLDVERLAPLADVSQDFVICSHVLEHLAEPIGFLVEMHRVLRTGGLAIVLLPDRRRTFDAPRAPTPLDHLVDEFHAGVTDVSDEHLEDFLLRTKRDTVWSGIPANPGERAAFFAWHRRRSIHVHCWTESEFLAVVLYTIGELGLRWGFVDGTALDDQGPEGIEFGYVLSRSPDELGPAERAARFRSDYEAWYRQRVDEHATARRRGAVA